MKVITKYNDPDNVPEGIQISPFVHSLFT